MNFSPFEVNEGPQISSFKVRIGGAIKNYDPSVYFSAKELKRYDPFIQYGLIAAEEAFLDSGIEVTEDNVSMEVMRSVCLDGPGHYLGHSQTLELMQTEYIYPALGDRTSPKEWAEKDRPDLIKKAIKLKEKLLSNPSKANFPKDLDEIIRSKFKIHLELNT